MIFVFLFLTSLCITGCRLLHLTTVDSNASFLWPSMQVRKQQLELDMEQQTGCKSEKEYVKAVYCHPAYLTYMQITS